MLLRLMMFICNAYGNVSCVQLPVEIHMNTERKCITNKLKNNLKYNTNQIHCDCKCASDEHHFGIEPPWMNTTSHSQQTINK